MIEEDWNACPDYYERHHGISRQIRLNKPDIAHIMEMDRRYEECGDCSSDSERISNLDSAKIGESKLFEYRHIIYGVAIVFLSGLLIIIVGI